MIEDRHELKFDRAVRIPKCVIFAIFLKENNGNCWSSNRFENKMTFMQEHCKLGHCNKDATHKATKQFGWELKSRSMDPSKSWCVTGKAKQKSFYKSVQESQHKTTRKENHSI